MSDNLPNEPPDVPQIRDTTDFSESFAGATVPPGFWDSTIGNTTSTTGLPLNYAYDSYGQPSASSHMSQAAHATSSEQTGFMPLPHMVPTGLAGTIGIPQAANTPGLSTHTDVGGVEFGQHTLMGHHTRLAVAPAASPSTSTGQAGIPYSSRVPHRMTREQIAASPFYQAFLEAPPKSQEALRLLRQSIGVHPDGVRAGFHRPTKRYKSSALSKDENSHSSNDSNLGPSNETSGADETASGSRGGRIPRGKGRRARGNK